MPRSGLTAAARRPTAPVETGPEAPEAYRALEFSVWQTKPAYRIPGIRYAPIRRKRDPCAANPTGYFFLLRFNRLQSSQRLVQVDTRTRRA